MKLQGLSYTVLKLSSPHYDGDYTIDSQTFFWYGDYPGLGHECKPHLEEEPQGDEQVEGRLGVTTHWGTYFQVALGHVDNPPCQKAAIWHSLKTDPFLCAFLKENSFFLPRPFPNTPALEGCISPTEQSGFERSI